MAEEKDDHLNVESPEIHFDPIVSLPVVAVKSLEEEEEELVKLRAKLFRFDNAETPGEWKERGVGDVKILRHSDTQTSRILMRRDKTFKICANHLITAEMEMLPSAGCDRAWVWSTLADFADEEAKAESLAIRFKNAENAKKFHEVFLEAQKNLAKKIKENGDGAEGDGNNDSKAEAESEDSKESTDVLTNKIGELSVKDSNTEDKNTNEEETKDSAESKE